MSTFLVKANSQMNPDEDFVLHGQSTSYWEKPAYLNNSNLTSTTGRLSQQMLFNPNNYRERSYARTLGDLAHNLEIVSDNVSKTLGTSYQAHQSTDNFYDSLRANASERELDKLYSDKVQHDSFGGRPKSSKESEWYLRPQHLSAIHSEGLPRQAASYRSRSPGVIGATLSVNKMQDPLAEKLQYFPASSQDISVMKHFPITLGASYEYFSPLSRSLIPPQATTGIRRSRSKSPTIKRRPQSSRSPTRNYGLQGVVDIDKDNLDKVYTNDVEKLYLTTKEAPNIGSSFVALSTPYQSNLGMLRMERLRIEEERLLELKRLEELERIRGPKPKWYESKGPDFYYESHKNTELIKHEDKYNELMDYRDQLIQSAQSMHHGRSNEDVLCY